MTSLIAKKEKKETRFAYLLFRNSEIRRNMHI